jgi:hypothetical protein
VLVLLQNTDSFQQFEDFVRACSTWSVFSRSRTSSDKNLQIVEDGTVFSRSRTSSDKNLHIVEVGQYLVKVEKY